MKINQYLCNMNVLVGLAIANDIDFTIYIPFYVDHFNYSLHDIDDDSPQIKMALIIFIKGGKRIEVDIWKNKMKYVIYEQNMKRNEPGTFADLDVFLR